MNLLKTTLASLLILFLISCKDEVKKIPPKAKNTLPNFSSVNFKKIFKPADSKLSREDSIRNILEDYYQNVWEGSNLWGGIIVAKGDKILLEKYRGFTDEAKQNPIDENTPLHIASISKTITAMAILKLIEAGKIDLNQQITTLFPNFPYPKIRIKDLLNHRSGLPKYEIFEEEIKPLPTEFSKKFITNQDILNIIIRHKPELTRESNTSFAYCNTNYALLALVIEKVTQKPFPEAMQEMIFQPLGMKNTFVLTENKLSTATPSFFSNGKIYPYNNLDLIYGDKNIYTTPQDLLRFSQAMFSSNFLPKNLIKKVFKPYSNEKKGMKNYGLGIRMKIFDNGKALTYHNGWWHGSNSVFVHLPESKTTIIALGNKYSRRIYSATALSGLFEDFPFDIESLTKEPTSGE